MSITPENPSVESASVVALDPRLLRALLPTSLGIYAALILLTTAPFLLLYRSPTLRHRNPVFTVLAVLCNLAFTTMVVVRDIIQRTNADTEGTFPCAVGFWFTSLLPPLAVMILCGRGVQLAFAYKLSQEALVVADRDSGSSNGAIGRSMSIAQPAATASLGEVLGKHYRDRAISSSSIATSVTSTSTKRTVWYTRNRRQASTPHILYYIGAALTLYIAGLVAVQVLSPRLLNFTNSHTALFEDDCTTGWEYIPLYGFLGLLLLIVNPIILISARGVDDAFGIKFELAATSVVWLVAVALDVVWTFIPEFPPPLLKHAWPHYMWLVSAFVLTHCLTVMRPVWLYWSYRRTHVGDNLVDNDGKAMREEKRADATSRSAFELVLSDPALFDDFKRFAVKDFSVENALFYERAAKFRVMTSSNGGNAPATMSHDDTSAREARKIYYLFLREHADLQLNLTDRTVRNIESDIRLKRFHAAMFDRALGDVVQLMWTDTYPRYIRGKTRDWRKDITRRVSGKGSPPHGPMSALTGIMRMNSRSSARSSTASNFSGKTVTAFGGGSPRRSLTPIPL